MVSIKLHIWHLIVSHLLFPGNGVVVLLTLLWIRMRLSLGDCLHAMIGRVLMFSCGGIYMYTYIYI